MYYCSNIIWYYIILKYLIWHVYNLTIKVSIENKLMPSNAEGASSIPGWGAKIPHALGPKNQNIKQAIL